MDSLIFLNLNQKKILDQAGIGVKSLTKETLQDYLTATDCFNILNNSQDLQSEGKLLYTFGFTDGFPICENDRGLTISYGKNIFKNLPTDIVINAACQNKNAIVLWEEECCSTTPNDMFGKSCMNILKAFQLVIPFEQLKQLKLFELYLLNQ